MVERTSREILRKIEIQRKLMGMTQKEFSLKMEGGPQWLTKIKQDGREFKVNDWIKAGDVLGVNPCHLLPDDILENLNNENIEEAIKILTNKGFRIILEESEQKKSKSENNG
ncbi:MAG: helix-turn-helix transcriptional regulator [Candidatus Omnitrophica bacterium]|nr:helix-turn-helix transcriptional regulator [Candidatus Omnitrophota bacterium]